MSLEPQGTERLWIREWLRKKGRENHKTARPLPASYCPHKVRSRAP